MKRVTLATAGLIGAYTLLRNNVGVLPDGAVWITNPDIFYKVFIPLLMTLSAIVALARMKKLNYFLLVFAVVFIDAINRLAVGVNHMYRYQKYKHIPQPEPVAGETVVVTNLWPSHIIFLIEAALIIFLLLDRRAERADELSS
jgi:hypothetical protein